MNGQVPSKISNTEWGLVIGALALIDIAQIGVDLVGIGFFVNWIVDIVVGMSFAFYLQMRGESLADGKRLLGLGIAFLGGELSGGALPLWVLDGIWCWFISKGKSVISQAPIISQVSKTNNIVRFPKKQNGGDQIQQEDDSEQIAA